MCAGDSDGDFVAFEGSLQLNAELVNHRGPSGSWAVTTAGCTGLADAYLRMQVRLCLMRVQKTNSGLCR